MMEVNIKRLVRMVEDRLETSDEIFEVYDAFKMRSMVLVNIKSDKNRYGVWCYYRPADSVHHPEMDNPWSISVVHIQGGDGNGEDAPYHEIVDAGDQKTLRNHILDAVQWIVDNG